MKQPRPGLVIAGKYRLERPLACGGMGSVWVATHLDLDVLVAIKFIASAAFKEARARFQREARAAARVKSPHVVHVQDFGLDGDLPYLVMELLHGEDLAARLKREHRLSLLETLTILVQLAKALRKTHEQGIVHRDLKPGNVFLVKGDDDEMLVKIVDFGIAKGADFALSVDATTTGNVIGSPSYMSPEQVRGRKDVDGRSDLWSLAVILYRAVTGQLPFASDVHSDLLIRIVTEPVAPPTSFVPDLPPAIDDFFIKALARDRDARFQSAREMTEAFALIVRPSVRPSFSSSSSLEPQPSDAAGTSPEKPSTTRKEPPEPGAAPSETPEESATSPPPTSHTLPRIGRTKPSLAAKLTRQPPRGLFARKAFVGGGVAALVMIGGGVFFMVVQSTTTDAVGTLPLKAPAQNAAVPSITGVVPFSSSLPESQLRPPSSPPSPEVPSLPVQTEAPAGSSGGAAANAKGTAEPALASPTAASKPPTSSAKRSPPHTPTSSTAGKSSSPPNASKPDYKFGF